MQKKFFKNLAERQKIAILCPSARFSKNFFLHYFTVSYIILDLLESYCKLQDMYSVLKWHQDLLFSVPDTINHFISMTYAGHNNFCNELKIMNILT